MLSEADALAATPPYGFLHDYVAYASQCTDAHVAYHLLCGLIALAQTVPPNYGFPMGDELVHPNLFVLCAGPSTHARKSASISIARRLVSDVNPDSVLEDPGSPEGLLEAVRASPRCLLVWDEFGHFLSRTKQGYAEPLRTALTSLYDCQNPGRALANKRRGAIVDPRVSAAAGSTLSFLESHTTPVDWHGGFLARFLTMYCDRERTFTMPPPAVEGRDQLVKTLQVLADLDSIAGTCHGMTPESHEYWNHWYFESEKRAGDAAREVQAGVYRAQTIAIKVALLLAWDFGHSRQGDWILELDLLQMATRIVDMSLDSVLEIGAHLSTTRDGRDCKAVLAVIEGSPKPVPIATVITKSKVGLKKRVMEVLATLEEGRQIQRLCVSGTDYYARMSLERAEQDAEADVINLHAAASESPVLE